MNFDEQFEEMLDKERDTFDNNVRVLGEERSVLAALHTALAAVTGGNEDEFSPGGGYIYRSFGIGTHNEPVLHYRMTKTNTEKDITHLLSLVRAEFRKRDISIHLKDMIPPTKEWRRWTYDFAWEDGSKKGSFSIIIWMATGGVCSLVEDGWKDPEKKYKVECSE